MRSSAFTQRNYWAVVPFGLEEVASKLASSLGLWDYEIREEDTDCWIEGWLPDRTSVYVCRDRKCTLPLRFIITPPPSDIANFGRRLAKCLGIQVSHGDVSYLGEEKFVFSEESRFDPKNA
jgi:hypothetical protein